MTDFSVPPKAPALLSVRPNAHVPRTCRFFTALAILIVLHFTLLRAGLVLRNYTSIQDASFWQILTAFVVGLRFDFAIACYLVLPFAIIGQLPGIGLDGSRRHRRIFLWVFSTIMVLLTLVCLGEYEFFKEFQTRFNQLALDYLDQKETVAGMVWYGYPVVRYLLIWIAISALFVLGLRWIIRWSFPPATHPVPGWPGKKQGILEIGWMILLYPLLVIGARGGLQAEPLRWGDAYVGENEFANQVGLNGLFTLSVSVRDRFGNNSAANAWAKKMSPQDADGITRKLLFSKPAILLDPVHRTVLANNPLAQNTVELHVASGKRPNIVLVLMESFSARFVGSCGTTPRTFTPEFDKLAADGYLFRRNFSSGTHTHQGVFASLLGFPNLPGYETLMQNMVSNQPFLGLPTLFEQANYQTLFLYNGNLAWDNMEGFFRKHGIDKMVGASAFDDAKYVKDKVWGVSDKDLVDRANEEFEKANRAGPFFGVVLTLSNHAPFDLPQPLPFPATTGMGELNKRLDGVQYADWAIGQFMERARTLEYFNNTLFVFVGDHGFHVAPTLSEINLLYHHVPLLFYSPALLDKKDRGVVSDVVSSQVNIAPTLISLAKIEAPTAFWGRNLFATYADPNFAIFKNSGGGQEMAMTRDDKLLVVSRNGSATLYRYDLGFKPSITPLRDPASDETRAQMTTELHAYVQSALDDLRDGQAGPELLRTVTEEK